MNITVKDITAILSTLALVIFSVLYLLKMKRVHDAIDSVADARVIEVINLGRGSDGKNQFAIKYQVLLDAPFEILVTPTKVFRNMGDLVTIYYDSQDHSNYYIPEKWKLDDRIKKALIFVLIAVVCFIGCIVTIVTRG